MATPSEILANIFGGQTAKPMTVIPPLPEDARAAFERGAATDPDFAPTPQLPSVNPQEAGNLARGVFGLVTGQTTDQDLTNMGVITSPDGVQMGITPDITPEAAFTMPNGQQQFVYPQQDVGAAFGRPESTMGQPSPSQLPQAGLPAMGVEATKQRLGDIFAGIEGKQPPSIEGMTLSEFTAQDPASIAAQQATQAFEAESAAREARLDTMLRDRAMARQSQRGAKPELTAEERQAEAEAQIAEAKAEAARQALQDPNISDYEKFTSELELSDLTPQQRRAATLKRFGLNPLDYPEGGEGVSTAETQDAGSTPATSINVEALSGDDKQAYEWAQANKDDPRAKQILDRLSAK